MKLSICVVISVMIAGFAAPTSGCLQLDKQTLTANSLTHTDFSESVAGTPYLMGIERDCLMFLLMATKDRIHRATKKAKERQGKGAALAENCNQAAREWA